MESLLAWATLPNDCRLAQNEHLKKLTSMGPMASQVALSKPSQTCCANGAGTALLTWVLWWPAAIETVKVHFTGHVSYPEPHRRTSRVTLAWPLTYDISSVACRLPCVSLLQRCIFVVQSSSCSPDNCTCIHCNYLMWLPTRAVPTVA